MGDPTEFYNSRGPNKPLFLEVTYHSGRKEKHEYKSHGSMERAQWAFAELPTVKLVKRINKGEKR